MKKEKLREVLIAYTKRINHLLKDGLNVTRDTFDERFIEAFLSTLPAETEDGGWVSGWQLCPKCSGQGTVSKPPYIPGDVHQWTSSAGSYQCDVCNGQKILAISTSLPSPPSQTEKSK